jgi:hypothetical protein
MWSPGASLGHEMSGLLPRSSVVVTWKAGCGESRTSGLEWGKDREVLPITTGVVATSPPYPTRALNPRMAHNLKGDLGEEVTDESHF